MDPKRNDAGARRKKSIGSKTTVAYPFGVRKKKTARRKCTFGAHKKTKA